ncbi:glycosyltransferase family 39 protein [Microvirga tunisiensis]|uniref:Glycosyltransferase RgtA/B/C/D-like domain-containing protein n=1 Tax=Microvirga tunisiensis TaxID=2108360 RepID=A0A5N7MTN8_9HYPH|nr:hypothetical protein [Microvirga tunisiensis]MPR12435.1 hypothetical protein [Microvirga tunisiensis]MPR30355.1 hypothetical protein [Microvirga tunisiensis]
MVPSSTFARLNAKRVLGPSIGELSALFGILAGATLLRLIGLDDLPLWSDEALTIVQSQWSVSEMVRYPTDPTPFLYYWLHSLLFNPDDSAAVMRSLSVAAGVVSVALMYVLARLCFDAKFALFAAALLAVWTSHVGFSQEARQYSLLFALTLLTSVGLVTYGNALADPTRTDVAKTGRRRLGLLLFCIGNVFSWYSHATAAIWIASTSILLLVTARSNLTKETHLKEVTVTYVAMAVCSIPGLVWIYAGHRYGHEHVEWLQQPGPVQVISRVGEIYFPNGFWNFPWTSDPAKRLEIKSIVLVACSICLIVGGVKALPSLMAKPPEHRLAYLLIFSYLAVPILLWAIGLVTLPVLLARTVLYSLPGFILLVGLLVSFNGRWAVWVSGSILFAFLISTILEIAGREKDDYRGAAAFLAAHVRSGDVILVCPAYDYPGLRHASRTIIPAPVLTVRTNQHFLELEPALGSNPQWAESFRRLVQIPELESRLGEQLYQEAAAYPERSTSALLRIAPGASVWRFDGRCEDFWSQDDARTLTDRALDKYTIDPALGWKQVSRVDGKIRLQISHYAAPKGGTLSVSTQSAP